MMIRILLLVVALLLPSYSWAAITFDSVTDSSLTQSVGTLTKSVIVNAGTNRILVLCAGGSRGGSGNVKVTGATFNGTEAFTLAREDSRDITTLTWNSAIWYLVNPTVTTANVVVTWSGTGNTRAQGFSTVQLNGVNQSSPVDSSAGANGTSGTPSAIITTVADGAWIVDCPISSVDAGMTVGAGQTARTDRVGGAFNEAFGLSTVNGKATAGAETMDWTQADSGGQWVTSVVSFVPSGGSDPNPVVPGQVTLTWVNGTDPGSPASGIVNTTIRRCTGASCAVATAGPGIGSVSFPQTTFIDNTVTVGTTYGYAAFHTDGVPLAGPNSGTAYITTSSTPPATPPTITGLTVDATGADLTYGSVTPTQIEVNIYSNIHGTISSLIHEMSDFPAGRFTNTWINGYDGVCFVPIDASGVKNTLASAYRCLSLTSIVGPLDTTPPTLSSCQPTTDRPAGTTSWAFSCNLNKPGAVKYDTVDTTYDLMANDMAINSLTASATKSGLTNGSTTTLYLRPAVQDIFNDIHAATSSTVVTITVANSTVDVTPPADVTNLAGTVLGNAVSLTWDAAADAVSYQVYQSSDNVTFFPAGNPVGVTNLQLALAFNTTYYWKVKALDSSANLSALFSNTVTKTTPLAPDNTPPSDLEGLQVEVFTNSVRASWITGTDASGPVSTNLEYCLSEIGQVDCANFSITVSNIGQSFLTLNLLPGRWYCFRGKNADGSGNVSVNYSATVCKETATTGLGQPRPSVPFGVTRSAPSGRSAPSSRPVRP